MNSLLVFLCYAATVLASDSTAPSSPNGSLQEYYNNGLYAYQQKDFEGARNLLERTIVLAPNKYPVAYFTLGRIYREGPSGDPFKSFVAFEKVVELTRTTNAPLAVNAMIMQAYVSSTPSESVRIAEQSRVFAESNSIHVENELAYVLAYSYNRRGLELQSRSKLVQAVRNFAAARRHRPGEALYASNLLSAYADLLTDKSLRKEYCSSLKTVLTETASIDPGKTKLKRNRKACIGICGE